METNRLPELETLLLSKGFKSYPTFEPTFPERERKNFSKRLPSLFCANNNSPSLDIAYSAISIHGIATPFCNIGIYGTNDNNVWFHFEAYSLSPDTVILELDKIEKQLTLAWQTLRN